MENKTVIDCPNCKQKLRIPIGKHIKFTCPNCSNEFEIDNRAKKTIKKSNYYWIYGVIISCVLVCSYKLYTNNKAKEVDLNGAYDVGNIINNSQNVVDQENIANEVYKKNLNTLVKAVDISNETTNDFAVRLASKFPGEYNIGQICQIYDYVVNNWKYVNDSDKMENLRSASRTIKNDLSGDCDDFAILIAATVESIGGDSRISFAYDDKGGHAFTEVLASNNVEDMQSIVDDINELYGTDQFEINYTEDTDGKCWLNLDWFGEPRHPGGEYFNFKQRTIYYPTSKYPTYTQE